jgi:hypothetical protein
MLRLLVAGLSPRSPGFAPGSVHVGFVMGKAAPGQVFLVFFCFLLSVFHRGAPYSYIVWVMNNRSSGGRSSEA